MKDGKKMRKNPSKSWSTNCSQISLLSSLMVLLQELAASRKQVLSHSLLQGHIILPQQSLIYFITEVICKILKEHPNPLFL